MMKLHIITIKKILVYTLLTVLIYETIIKYVGVSWVSTVYANVVSMQGKTIPRIKYIIFILIVLMGLSEHFYKKNVLTFSGISLIVVGVFWCIFDFDSGLALIYLDSPPALLIEIGCLFLVLQDDKIRKILIKLCGFFAVFFTVLTVVDLMAFLKEYSLIRIANGNIIEHFANSLFLVTTWNCFIECEKQKTFVLYGCSISLVLISVFITSRGWMIQSVMLMASVYLSNSKRNIFEKVKRVILVICIFACVYLIITTYMNDAFSYLIDRIGQDTRSLQLVTFFEQVPITKLIVGQGANATYLWNGSAYAYVDNIYLFWMLRYGIVSVIAYWIPFIYGLVAKNKNSYLNSKFQYSVMIVMWMAAMGGLCIYYSIRLDIANIFLIVAIIEYINQKKSMDI